MFESSGNIKNWHPVPFWTGFSAGVMLTVILFMLGK